LLCLICLPTGRAIAVDLPPPQKSPAPDALATQRAGIESATNLTEDQKKQALTRLDDTRALIEEANRFDARVQELREKIRQAPAELSRLRNDKSVADLRLNRRDIEPWTDVQLEVVLSERQARLGELQGALAEKDKRLANYLSLARTGGTELSLLEGQLADMAPSASDQASNAATDLVRTIEQQWRTARELALKAQINWLKLQQGNLNLVTELAQLDRDLSAAQVEALREHVAQLRDYSLQRRQASAEASSQAAEQALSGAPEAIRELRQRISGLALEQAKLIGKEADIDRQIERVNGVTEELKRDLDRLNQIVELGGAAAQVSNLLQKRRSFAPSPKSLAQQALEYQQQLSDAALRQLELDELLRDSRDIDAKAEQLLADLPAGTSEPERTQIGGSAREAWSQYRTALLDLWKGYTRYIGRLSALEAGTRQLLETARSYREFIDDRLLWMPSTELVPMAQASLLFSGTTWLTDPTHLGQLVDDAIQVVSDKRLLTGLWLLGFVALIRLRKRALAGLESTATGTQKVRTDSFNATLRALLDTLILILPLPWLFVGAGLLLGNLRAAHEFTLIVAVGLQSTGHTLLFLYTLRQTCRSNGIARVHLQWDPALCDNLRRQAIWLAPLAAPLAFLASVGATSVPSGFIHITTVAQPEEAGLLAIGRLAAGTLLVLLAIAIHRVWRKEGPVMQALRGRPERAQWANYHLLWFAPAILFPLGLALAGVSGYYYTTAYLAAKASETLWFVFVLMFLKDLLLRGLYVTQRRLRFEEAVRYREQASAQRLASGEAAASADADTLPIEEDKINYGQLGDQVRQLVQLGFSVGLLAGLWWIWADVIPAFSFLDKIQLPVTTSKLIDGVSQDVPLTLGDMATGLLLGGLALFAARNVPALLELTLLQRLPLTRASRYAVTTMTQYLVALIGLVITFKALGLQWSSIQWLVAALSVGLGFGLQEIVANFISGIILLFEQPIRVGDIVTVEDTTGTVSRIRIRATTIVNWERQELVIPNKSFITGRLINWTLSDTVNRLTITVGVAYDTDTDKAMELMRQAATEHPKVLADPAPRISFEGFGDNALTLVMRAFLNDVDARLQTITELHGAVLQKFRAAGIAISFPQRDLHLDSSRPIELVLRRDAQQRSPAA